jgi:cell division protein FtsQ
MQTYQEFMNDIDLVRSGSSDRVSEVDLANPKDLRAVMTGIASPGDPQALTIHFGSGDFTGKYRMVVENFVQWQAGNGRIHSIDLQYAKQVVLNPDTTSASASKTR